MTRERWEQILFAHVEDEVVQDMLNEYVLELESSNTKLRELADAVKEFVEDTHCEDCPCRRDCDDNNSIFCANDFSYHAFAAMRELGMETE